MRLYIVLSLSISLLLLSKVFGEEPGTPPSQKDLWTPPAGLVLRQVQLPESAPIPPNLIARIQELTLLDLIDLALLNSPKTRVSWYAARSAQEELAGEKGSYYPEINLGLDANRAHGSAVGGRFTFDQKSIVPSVALSYTLFDFGKRTAEVDEKRQELIAANWEHNAAVQNIVLQVQQAYYQYLDTRALLQAQEATVKEAKANLEAAEERHKAGVATIADVLQAKTVVSQVQLILDTTHGAIQTVRGIIATALGISPASDFDVKGELPEELPVEEVSQNIEALIREAHEKRPELAAARADALKEEAHVRNIKAEGRPVLETGGSLQRIYYVDPSFSSNNYSFGIFLRFPLFTGFRHTHDVRQAEADAEAAKARTKDLQQQVTLQVWISYFDVKTAAEKIQTGRNLLESAQQSHDVALGRYKSGVGSILELLSSQAALEDARSQLIRAKTDWLLSVAQLAHDTGTLWLSTEGIK